MHIYLSLSLKSTVQHLFFRPLHLPLLPAPADCDRSASPLNLSLRTSSPARTCLPPLPSLPALVKTEVKAEPPSWGPVSPPREAASPPRGVWSRGGQQGHRIWSPAVTCENENKLSTNNNNVEAKVGN